MSKTETPVPSGDELRRAAEMLTGGAEAEVAKAADADEKPEAKKDEDGEDKEKEGNPFTKTEKAVTLTEAELGSLIEKAVDAGFAKAQTLFAGELAPIAKSLETLTGDTEAIKQFQGATTMVLTNFKSDSDAMAAQVSKLEEISKSIQHEVEAIGDQPAAPKSVVVMEKAAETPAAETVSFDAERVAEVAKSFDDIGDVVTFKQYVQKGNVDALRHMLSPVQRNKLGLTK